MNLTTNRLTICEIDYEQTVGISNKNSDKISVANYFASLNKEQLSLIISNKVAVANLVSTLESKCQSQSRVYYGAWKNDELFNQKQTELAEQEQSETAVEVVTEAEENAMNV